MSAKEASAALDISPQTLYAYVSRGMIRSEATDGSRARRYRSEDIAALLARKAGRRDPQQVASQALHFGAPVLDSQITLIRDGCLYYRGLDVMTLARQQTLEQVAALIWLGDLQAHLPSPGPMRLPAGWRAVRRSAARPVQAFQVLVPLAGMTDPGGFELDPASVTRSGQRILSLLSGIATRAGRLPRDRTARVLQAAWSPAHPAAVKLFDAALICCADHELNVSAFTARCVASAGASPYAAVTAGLAALQGPKHGGHCDRVEALFEEAASPERAHRTLADRLRRGDLVPGFGHPLYPDGDPRGALLLSLVRSQMPDSPSLALADALVAAAAKLLGKAPTIDLGLVTLARSLDCPEGAALGLFAMGRTVGWIGQALEQYQTDRMIRPRALYVGPQPGGA